MEVKQSKSARKREYLELQVLGEKLIGFPEEKLHAMQLDDSLVQAIVTASSIKSHSALRRQHQLIGKLMKYADREPIRKALDTIQQSSQESKQNFKRAEEWRDRIIRDGMAGLQLFMSSSGIENSDLANLVSDYERARTEASRRTLRRSIFRQVHNDLNIARNNSIA